MLRKIWIVLGAVALANITPASAATIEEAQKLPASDVAAEDRVPGEVLVKFSPEGLENLSLDRRGPNFPPPALLRDRGATDLERVVRPRRPNLGRLERGFGLDRLFLVRFPEHVDTEQLSRQLAREPFIEYAHPNYLIEAGASHAEPLDTYFASQQWNLHNTGQTGGTVDADIDAAEAWRVATGSRRIRLALMDTGIKGKHPELRERVGRGGFDAEDVDYAPIDLCSHGTQVGGVMAATSQNGFGVTGVNWWSDILPIQTMKLDGLGGCPGSLVGLVRGIAYAAESGADVVNMSIVAGTTPNSAIADAVAFSEAAGVIQVGCSGNDGTGDTRYPGSFPEVISVGFTDHDDARAPGSNYNATIEVVAPGRLVPTAKYVSDIDEFVILSGCSFAAPQVSGIIGVLLALDPTLTSDQVRTILQTTADDQVGVPTEDTPGRDDFHGWGRVNMDAAVRALGLVSHDLLHVAEIRLVRTTSTSLEIRVSVLDDLTGVEEGVLVDGTLTLPDSSTLALNGTTGSSGMVVLVHESGGILPSGGFTFRVDDLSKPGSTYDSTANEETERTHDPDLDGMHVRAIDLWDDFQTLVIEVQVWDDDDRAEGDVTVSGQLLPPSGSPAPFAGIAEWSAAGVAHFEHAPAILEPGDYTFQVTSLSKAGFIHETGRDVVSESSHTVLDSLGDFDGDAVSNSDDNCLTIDNPGQQDTDGDGTGDACDVCPDLIDPAQEDYDADGAGDRCDCAPWEATRSRPSEVSGLRFDPDKATLRWHGVSGADFYDISRGSLSALDGGDFGPCLADDRVGMAYTDLDPSPAPGDGFAYLVVADDAICGTGPLGASRPVNSNPRACFTSTFSASRREP